jgi:hypothetical protein
MINGLTSLEIDENNLMMEYPRKINVKCILCGESFPLLYKNIPIELKEKIKNENINT